MFPFFRLYSRFSIDTNDINLSIYNINKDIAPFLTLVGSTMEKVPAIHATFYEVYCIAFVLLLIS